MEGSQPVDLSQHPSGIVPMLQNIVSTVNLDCKLDLKAIALQARNAEYNPKRFAAVIMRIREPKTTALIFASGKMVCTGAKSEQQSKLAARKYARIIQKLGFPAKFKDPKRKIKITIKSFATVLALRNPSMATRIVTGDDTTWDEAGVRGHTGAKDPPFWHVSREEEKAEARNSSQHQLVEQPLERPMDTAARWQQPCWHRWG